MTPRRAELDDLPAIEALVARAYGVYRDTLGIDPAPLHDDYAAHIARGAAFVVEGAHGMLGLLVLADRPNHLLLDNVAVDPAAQGQGIGGLLIDFAEAQAALRGHAEIRLYTHERMSRNVTIYARRGYRETRRATEDGRSRIYMAKTLGPAVAPDA